MRIAVLTFHRAYNCGAMLQAWALKTILERMGHEVSFPDCNSVGVDSPWIPFPKGKCSFVRLIRRLGRYIFSNVTVPISGGRTHLHCNRFARHLPVSSSEPSQFGEMFDLVVIGSDQVWSEFHSAKDAPLFFGETLPSRIPFLFYAASFGDREISETQVRRIADSANRSSAVSVREAVAIERLQPFVRKPMSLVLDPTLLLTANDYDSLMPAKVPFSRPFLFAYVLLADSDLVRQVKALAKVLGLRPIIAPMYQKSLWRAPHGLTFGISPDRLIWYTRYASCIVTTSFHGTVMAVLHDIPFISFCDRNTSTQGRIGTLLGSIGEMDRLVPRDTRSETLETLLRTPLNSAVHVRLGEVRNESLDWLKNAIRQEESNGGTK